MRWCCSGPVVGRLYAGGSISKGCCCGADNQASTWTVDVVQHDVQARPAGRLGQLGHKRLHVRASAHRACRQSLWAARGPAKACSLSKVGAQQHLSEGPAVPLSMAAARTTSWRTVTPGASPFTVSTPPSVSSACAKWDSRPVLLPKP